MIDVSPLTSALAIAFVKVGAACRASVVMSRLSRTASAGVRPGVGPRRKCSMAPAWVIRASSRRCSLDGKWLYRVRVETWAPAATWRIWSPS